MKKHVGRPSNDELRSRKNKQILIIFQTFFEVNEFLFGGNVGSTKFFPSFLSLLISGG